MAQTEGNKIIKMKKILLILLLLPLFVLSQIPDAQPSTYVNDFAHVLTTDQVSDINKRVHALEEKYSIQLAIVFISVLPVNYEIEDYAREIGRKWRVGNARNGLVYVAAINQRKQRLEVAANLEGIIPDIIAKRITDNIKPFFRSNDYAGGLLNMIKEIDDIINPEAQEQRKLAEAERQKKADNVFSLFLVVMCWLLGIATLVVAVFLLVKKRKKKSELTSASGVSPISPSVISALSVGRSRKRDTIRRCAPTITTINSDAVEHSSSLSSYRASSSSDNDSSSSSSSSDYGSWGSGSSDTSSSSDSGYNGGGSSNDW